MTRTCPDCGSPVDYVSRTARVLEGSCSGCGHTITVLENLTGGAAPSPASEEEGMAPEGRAAPHLEGTGWSGPRLTCGACGAGMTLHRDGERVQAVCSACGRTSGYVLEGPSAPELHPRRPPRLAPSDEGRGGFGPSRARPCRECGGPLRFSTAPDGTISGECDQCGNRFTLPPRRDSFPGRRERGGGRFDRGSGPRFGRSGPPRRFGQPSGARYRPTGRRADRDDEEEDRPRRRPRRG